MARYVGISVVMLALTAGLFLVAGCESESQNSALLGSAIGAGVGALAGGDTEGALIGAAIGGGVGYMAGNESEKKRTQQDIASVRAEQNTVTVWITNSNGSKIPVRLNRQGPGYVGPRGEYYPTLPPESDLRPVYGF